MKTINVFGITFSCFKYLFNNLHFRLVSRHFGKGGIQLFCDGLKFVLLIHKLIFQSVNLANNIILFVIGISRQNYTTMTIYLPPSAISLLTSRQTLP